MKYIFLTLYLISMTASAADNIASIKLEKSNNKPVTNIRLNLADDFRFDANTLITEKSLLTGKYDTDIGAIYKLTPIDSVRLSVTEKDNTMLVNYRHKF